MRRECVIFQGVVYGKGWRDRGTIADIVGMRRMNAENFLNKNRPGLIDVEVCGVELIN